MTPSDKLQEIPETIIYLPTRSTYNDKKTLNTKVSKSLDAIFSLKKLGLENGKETSKRPPPSTYLIIEIEVARLGNPLDFWSMNALHVGYSLEKRL